MEELYNSLQGVKHCYLVGRDIDKFISILEEKKIPYSINVTLEKALEEIKQFVRKGTVLLSPCCSSLDQWKDFEHRGSTFKEIVSKIFTP